MVHLSPTLMLIGSFVIDLTVDGVCLFGVFFRLRRLSRSLVSQKKTGRLGGGEGARRRLEY